MSKQQFASLQEQEHLILNYMAEGLSNRQIAERLSISSNTVKWYNQRIFQKLGVKRRTQAVAVARSAGLIASYTTLDISHLPNPVTQFIGRETELIQLVDLLNMPDCRLLTIIGPGGIGKTRLALALAQTIATYQDTPIYFVSLESIHSAESMMTAIGTAIGTKFGGQQDIREQLLASLAKRSMLLILDNCEHLLPETVFFPQMIATAYNLKIVATSREYLNLHEERIYLLKGLVHDVGSNQIQESEAVQLFMQSVHRVRNSYDPTPEELAHIHNVCSLVQGLPLAIELAAGWMDVMLADEIYDRLSKDMSILKTTIRDVPSRHQSMETVFEHSWQLMNPTIQDVFKRLSLFQSSFDRESAAAVAGASPEIMKQLLAQSNIAEVYPGRWKMHNLLRQFAEEKLHETPDQYHQAWLAYCHYYANLMAFSEHLFENDLDAFGKQIKDVYPHLDNITHAWQMIIEYPLVEAISKFITILSLLQGLGLVFINKRVFKRILQVYDAYPDAVTVVDRLRVLTHLGWFAYSVNELDDAYSLLHEATGLASHADIQNSPQFGLTLTFLGDVVGAQHNQELAKEHIQDAITHCRKINFEFGEANGYVSLAIVLVEAGQYDVADQLVSQAIHITKQSNFQNAVMWATALQAVLKCLSGNIAAGQDICQKILLLCQDNPMIVPTLNIITALSLILRHIDQSELALSCLALAIHHPQQQTISQRIAVHVLEQYRKQFTETEINHMMTKAQQGLLYTRYLSANFSIDAELIDQLLALLDYVSNREN